MDMRTNEIKRERILEPQEVEVGYQFVLCLVAFRLRNRNEPQPPTKEARAERFNKDKNLIAQQLGYDSYRSLPKDAKAFEGRCAALKKQKRSAFFQLASQEKAYNELVSEMLYQSIMEELHFYAPAVLPGERMYRLMLRMTYHSCRLPALDPIAHSKSA